MGRQIIELVEVLVDRIEKNGYQQRAREDDIADGYRRLNEAKGQAEHWRQARQDAIAAGELMQAEIASLRQQLAEAQQPGVDAMRAERERLANLVRFVEHVREFLSKNNSYITYADINGVRNALRLLDCQNPKVDVTAEGGT